MDSLLIEACRAPSNLTTVKWFMEYMNACPNYIDEEDGCNALIAAAQADNIDIVEYLLKYDFDLDVQEKEYGQTALHILVEQGCNSETIENLLDLGADKDIKDKSGKTVMDIALESHEEVGDYEEIIELLR